MLTPDVRPVMLLTDVPPEETPVEHIKNAIQILRLLLADRPIISIFHPEIVQADRRAQAAVVMLDNHAPLHLARTHLTGAVRAILAADLDFDVVPALRNATARLLHALYQIGEEVAG